MMVLWFVSLYLAVRISYRTIFAKVRESVPSLSRMKEAIIPMDDEDEIIPTKKTKADEVYKKKAEELEKKLAAIQKNKAPVKENQEPITGKALLKNALSGITKKIPLETPEGKIIESKNTPKSVNFGTWDFP